MSTPFEMLPYANGRLPVSWTHILLTPAARYEAFANN